MPTPVTFNGVQYFVPLFNDVGYAQGQGNLSAYLIALANGPFPIISTTPNPATAGVIRLAKTDSIDWRNTANSGNLPLAINSSDQLTFNGVPLSTGSSGVSSITGTANQIIASSSVGNITLSTPQNIATSSSPTFAGLTLSSPLSVANGGTGVSTITAHDILVGAGTSAITPVTPGTSGFVLTSNGTGSDPSCRPSGIGNIVSTATSGTITPDASTASTFYIAVSNTVTLNGPSNGVDGQKVTVRILNDASHSVTLATGSGNFRFSSDMPAYTNSVSLTDYIGAIWNAADSRWDVVAIIQGF